MEEIPLVLRAENKYADQKLTGLWIGRQDKIDKLTAYAKRNNIPDYLFDPDDWMSRKFGMTYGGGVVFIADGLFLFRALDDGLRSMVHRPTRKEHP